MHAHKNEDKNEATPDLGLTGHDVRRQMRDTAMRGIDQIKAQLELDYHLRMMPEAVRSYTHYKAYAIYRAWCRDLADALENPPPPESD